MPDRVGRVAAAVLLALFAAVVLALIGVGAPLEWDEAVYAGRARSWVSDHPASGWGIHRPPGVPMLAAPVVALTEQVGHLRLLGLVFGVALLVACLWLAWLLRGWAAAALAGLLVATVVPVLVRSSQLLTDVVAAAAVVTLAGVLWQQLGRDRAAGAWLWTAPAVGGAAFVLRYGALPFVALLLATAAVAWWRPLRAAPWRTATAVLVGAVVAGVHVLHALVATGHPLGIVRRARALAPQADLATTFQGYLTNAGAFGWPAVVTFVLGVVVLTTAAAADRREGFGLPRRAALLLLVPAIGGALLVASSSAALPRLLIPSFALVLTGLAVVVAHALADGSGVARLVAGALVVLAVVGVVGATQQALQQVRDAAVDRAPAAAVGRAIDARAGDRPCGVLAREVPVLTWYSGCDVAHFGYPPVTGAEASLTGGVRYLVLHSSQRGEPQGPDREHYLRLAEPDPIAIVPDPPRQAEYRVYRLR